MKTLYDKSDDGEYLKIDPKASQNGFKDRKDQDIDNGDEEFDEYLLVEER